MDKHLDQFHDPNALLGCEYFICNEDLPYVTQNLTGIYGNIKQIPSHFNVTELDSPLMVPDNKKFCHIFITIQRELMNTMEVQQTLSHILGYNDPRMVGFCGLKDKYALTTQTFSVPSYNNIQKRHLDLEEVKELVQLKCPSLKVLKLSYNSTKLRRNMHKGNRFQIILSNLQIPLDQALQQAQLIAQHLEITGWPNYYGDQRLSKGGQTALKGYKILQSLQNSKGGSERKKLKQSIMRSQIKMFQTSAFTSMNFNVWLSQRVKFFDQLLMGDLVTFNQNDSKKYEKQGFYELERVDDHQKLEYFQKLYKDQKVQNTGPIFGCRYPTPTDNTHSRQIEQQVQEKSGIKDSTYKMLDICGGRRLARISIQEMNLNIIKHQEGLQFSFSLCPGSYATTFLREFCKCHVGRDENEDQDETRDYKDDATQNQENLNADEQIEQNSDESIQIKQELKITTLKHNNKQENFDQQIKDNQDEPMLIKKTKLPLNQPLSNTQLLEKLNQLQISFDLQENDPGHNIYFLKDPGHNIYFLKEKKLKTSNMFLVLFPNKPEFKKSILEWTTKLEYKKDRLGMGNPEILLGCKPHQLTLFSIFQTEPIQNLTILIDERIMEQKLYVKLNQSNEDIKISLTTKEYIKLIQASKISHKIITWE